MKTFPLRLLLFSAVLLFTVHQVAASRLATFPPECDTLVLQDGRVLIVQILSTDTETLTVEYCTGEKTSVLDRKIIREIKYASGNKVYWDKTLAAEERRMNRQQRRLERKQQQLERLANKEVPPWRYKRFINWGLGLSITMLLLSVPLALLVIGIGLGGGPEILIIGILVLGILLLILGIALLIMGLEEKKRLKQQQR